MDKLDKYKEFNREWLEILKIKKYQKRRDAIEYLLHKLRIFFETNYKDSSLFQDILTASKLPYYKVESFGYKDTTEKNFQIEKHKTMILARAILEIKERLSINEEKLKNSEDKSIKILKIFMSYSSKDYELAKRIKDFLDDFGFDVFLAHTSIEPTLEWEEEIYKNLKNCDVFMPILTHNLKESNWADQESGIAYDRKKKILSLSVELVPYGFLGRFQALRYMPQTDFDLQNEENLKIIKGLMKDFPNKIKESLLFHLEKIYTYKSANNLFPLIKEIEKTNPFTKKEINKLLEESSKNNQIYEAHEAVPYLKELIKKYEKEIEQPIKEKIINALGEVEAREMLGGKSFAGSV